jgi:hypothetical protein
MGIESPRFFERKPEPVRTSYRPEERYKLEILKRVGKELGIQVRELDLIRGKNEAPKSYKARKNKGEWSVEIIPPAGLRDLSEFWKRVKEEEEKYKKSLEKPE